MDAVVRYPRINGWASYGLCATTINFSFLESHAAPYKSTCVMIREDSIRVGLTEAHGLAVEASQCPPAGVEYSFLTAKPKSFRILRSPIKGYYGYYHSTKHDLIEAVLSPISTPNLWIYSLGDFPTAAAFTFLGLRIPRTIRVAAITRLLLRDNCRKIIFRSEAGRATLQSYGGIQDERLLRKVTVVHPAVRTVPNSSIRFNERDDATLLFSGNFFRKGGVSVVDAFERVQRTHPLIKLTVCCDEKLDFHTPNEEMRREYLSRLEANPNIQLLGRISRERLLRDILPHTDIYVLPTYADTFGMSVLEAMAFGIPVIATNHFAIPEMLEDEVSGLLIDINRWDPTRLFPGYTIDRIPGDFRQYVADQLVARITRLVESPSLRETVGRQALAVARSRFSFETRNSAMLQIYRSALS